MSWLVIFLPLVASFTVFCIWLSFSGIEIFPSLETLKGIIEVLRREL